jgi:dephospho-CoA kinase
VLTVGLTGNYGMGKSTVLGMFGKLGAVNVGADGIVDTLLNDAAVLERIGRVLGKSVFSADGRLDRAMVASVIFQNKGKKDDVEEILHPLVFEKIEELLDGFERSETEGRIVIIEIPLLFEKEYTGRFHRTITVYTDEETALRRLEEKGVTRDMAALRLAAQMPVQEKIRRADFTIDNSGAREHTAERVRVLYNRLMDEAKDGHHKRT